MGVEIKHSQYSKWEEDWVLIETLLAGDRAIKGAGEAYLPKLSGQTDVDYGKYVARGSLFNATARTRQGLTGAIIRKEAAIEAPQKMLDVLQDITLARQSIHEVIRITVENIFSYGFFGILVDMPESSPAALPPYIALYSCRDILNWHTERVLGEDKIVMVALREVLQEQAIDDPFAFIDREQIRLLFIDPENGAYKQRIYRQTESGSQATWVQYGEDIVPTRQGIVMNEIPFVFINATSAFPQPSKPPLLDVANINIKHWQMSTDYYHGLHYCAMPTPWAAGFRIGAELYIGGQKAWISDDPNAKCGFLEFSGQGLGAIEKALTKLELLMAVLGARLLEEQKAGVEAAEAIKLRSSGDSATLTTIVAAVEEGIDKALQFIGRWMGIQEKISVKMNRSFVSQRLTPQDITALLQAVQAGRISMDTFLYNLQAGEILPPDRSIEEERDLIESEGPKNDFNNLGGQGQGNQGVDNNIFKAMFGGGQQE